LSTPSPLELRYTSLVSRGDLTPDPVQEEAIAELARLGRALCQWHGRARGLFARWRKSPPVPTGLYLWGGVGRGKTLLMDLFFNNLPPELETLPKRRVHFHEFMIEMHAAIDGWRRMSEDERRHHPGFRNRDGDDPIPPVARATAAQAKLLCFDEFQVTDITDAMILGRLFEGLFAEGITVVATSNRHPDDLYKDGLNRQLFVPFIDLFKSRLSIRHLQSARDYRLERLAGEAVYHTPDDNKAQAAMDRSWQKLTAGARERQDVLKVGSRTIPVKRCARGAARFAFSELCERPLGPKDYIALARRYGTIFLDHIPQLTPENRNAARRFVTLIDALYNHQVKLVCSAETAPTDLYQSGIE